MFPDVLHSFDPGRRAVARRRGSACPYGDSDDVRHKDESNESQADRRLGHAKRKLCEGGMVWAE